MQNFNHAQFIRDTIGAQIPEQYRAHAQRLAHAYADRDNGIVEVLRAAAGSAGIEAGEVDRLLVEAGLLVRPEPVNAARRAEPQGQVPEAGGGDRLDRLERMVQSLVEAARRRGIDVRP